MSSQQNLLSNIECEYKFALNPDYVESFVREFCEKFNEAISLRYQALPQSFTSEHALSEFIVDPLTVCKESLQNEYFDTATDLLFGQFYAGLRLRRSSKREGVEQTLKFKGRENCGASHVHKELNVFVPRDLQEPDLSLFKAEDLPEGLLDFVHKNPVQRKYQTDFVRERIVLTVPLFLSFELAVDQGDICAHNGSEGSEDHHSPICEVEFELKSIDEGYLKLMGANIHDLDDVRLEFSAFINEIMLLVAGAPKEYLDAAHLFGLEGDRALNANTHATDVVDGIEGIDGVYGVAGTDGVEGIEAADTVDSDSAIDIADAEVVESADIASEIELEKGYISSSEESLNSADSADFADSGACYPSSDAASLWFSRPKGSTGQLNLQACPYKEGGLIGREPLSKLKRAVLLNARYGSGAKGDSSQFRIDIDGLRQDLERYNQQEQPSLNSFIAAVTMLADAQSSAVGYANLFGLPENFADLLGVVELTVDFSLHHKPFTWTPKAKQRHHAMCQEPEFRDLSMILASECSSMFIEINNSLWLMPFYHQLQHAMESNQQFSLEQFKMLCRCTNHNSYSLKVAEYTERLLYSLKRCAMILDFEITSDQPLLKDQIVAPVKADADANGDEAQQKRSLTLATQYHMRLMWNNV